MNNVYLNYIGTNEPYVRWYNTPRGKLTISDAPATGSVNVNYTWFAEVGEVGATTGVVKQYGGFFNWGIDHNVDVVDKTDFEDSGHRSYMAVLDGWTATAERHWVDSGMKQYMGSKVIVKFYAQDDDTDKGIGSASDTGSRYEGYGIVVGMSPTVAVDTLVNESLSFQGTGILTYESG